MLLLSMISAFDETDNNNPKRNLLYNTSLSLAKWLMEKDNNEDWQIVYKLNYYQILKRLSGLVEDDINTLKQLQLESNENTLVQCGVSLLLEDKTSFEYYWKKLSKEEQEEFAKYPICKFRRTV